MMIYKKKYIDDNLWRFICFVCFEEYQRMKNDDETIEGGLNDPESVERNTESGAKYYRLVRNGINRRNRNNSNDNKTHVTRSVLSKNRYGPLQVLHTQMDIQQSGEQMPDFCLRRMFRKRKQIQFATRMPSLLYRWSKL